MTICDREAIDFCALANSGIRRLTPYQPGKPLEELERELGVYDAIKLASNENPLGASPRVAQHIQKYLQHTHIYPDGSCFELKQTLAAFLSVSSQQLTIGNGSENILELITKAYLSKESNAIISEYAFLTIPLLIQSYGAEIKTAPAHQYGHHVPALIQAVDKQTRVLFLVNPNNPTGTYVTDQDFQRLMNAVPAQVLVVVDEAYSEYIKQPDYPDALSYLSRYPNLIVTRTFSKVYGLAALRLGYAVSSPEIADILNRARLPFNVNTLAAQAACAALEDQAHVQKSVALNQLGMAQMQHGLYQLKLNYIPSVGNFITIDVGDAVSVYQALLRQGIIVRPLQAYNMPRHIRVTIGTSEQNERFLRAMEGIAA